MEEEEQEPEEVAVEGRKKKRKKRGTFEVVGSGFGHQHIGGSQILKRTSWRKRTLIL